MVSDLLLLPPMQEKLMVSDFFNLQLVTYFLQFAKSKKARATTEKVMLAVNRSATLKNVREELQSRLCLHEGQTLQKSILEQGKH